MHNLLTEVVLWTAIITTVILLAIVLSVSRGSYTTDEKGNKVYVPKLWKPPNSWEPGDGHPPGYDGVDLSEWRK